MTTAADDLLARAGKTRFQTVLDLFPTSTFRSGAFYYLGRSFYDDVKDTFKNKLDVDFRNYRILGACSPKHAHAAISSEDKIGLFLPCNVIVQDVPGGVEVAAVDPIASMMAVSNPGLGQVAQEVQVRLRRVIEAL